MKSLQEALQLHNTIDTMMQRVRERPVRERELKLRDIQARQGIELAPARHENERLRIGNEIMKQKELRAELISEAHIKGLIDADPEVMKELHQAGLMEGRLPQVIGTIRNGSHEEVAETMEAFKGEMDSLGVPEAKQQAVLLQLGKIQQVSKLGPAGIKNVEAMAQTPRKLLEATFGEWEREEGAQAFELNESVTERIDGIVSRSLQELHNNQESGEPLAQQRARTFAEKAIGAFSDKVTVEDGKVIKHALSGEDAFILQKAAEQFSMAVANQDAATFQEVDALQGQAQADSIIAASETDGPQYASMTPNETFGLAAEIVSEISPFKQQMMHNMLRTSGNLDPEKVLRGLGGVNLRQEIAAGRMNPDSAEARRLIYGATIRDWQRRIIQRGGQGSKHATQALNMAMRMVDNNIPVDPNTAIGQVLEGVYAKWREGAQAYKEERNLLSKRQLLEDDREMAYNGNRQVWTQEGKVAFKVPMETGAVGQTFMQIAAGMGPAPFGEFGGDKDFNLSMNRNDVFLFRPDVPGGYSPENIVYSIANLPSQIDGASNALNEYASGIRRTSSPHVLGRLRQQAERFGNLAAVLPNVDSVLEDILGRVGGTDVGVDDVLRTEEYQERGPQFRLTSVGDVVSEGRGDQRRRDDRQRLQFQSKGTRVSIEPPSLKAIQEMRGLSRRHRAALEDVLFHKWNQTVETLAGTEAGRQAFADPAGRKQFMDDLSAQAIEAENNARSLLMNLSKINRLSNDVAQNATISSDDPEVTVRAYEAQVLLYQAMDAMGIKPYNEKGESRYEISAPLVEGHFAGF